MGGTGHVANSPEKCPPTLAEGGGGEDWCDMEGEDFVDQNEDLDENARPDERVDDEIVDLGTFFDGILNFQLLLS